MRRLYTVLLIPVTGPDLDPDCQFHRPSAGRSLSLLDPTYASKYIPIIASVSEHQPPAWTSYFTDLNALVPTTPPPPPLGAWHRRWKNQWLVLSIGLSCMTILCSSLSEPSECDKSYRHQAFALLVC